MTIGLEIGTPNSANSSSNYVTFDKVKAILLYSASAELLETVYYFLDFQDINEPPNYTT